MESLQSTPHSMNTIRSGRLIFDAEYSNTGSLSKDLITLSSSLPTPIRHGALLLNATRPLGQMLFVRKKYNLYACFFLFPREKL